MLSASKKDLFLYSADASYLLYLPLRCASTVRRGLTGKVLCLILVGLTLAIGIPARQSQPYYHMIDKQDTGRSSGLGIT